MKRGENLRYAEGRAVCPSCKWGMPWHGAPVYAGHFLVASGGIVICPNCGQGGLVIEIPGIASEHRDGREAGLQ